MLIYYKEAAWRLISKEAVTSADGEPIWCQVYKRTVFPRWRYIYVLLDKECVKEGTVYKPYSVFDISVC